MKLSIIIPIYNEKATINEIVRRVLAVPMDKELILVDDASTDGSALIVRRLTGENATRLKAIYHKKNKGKGAAILTGLDRATGEVIVIQDADLEYSPEELPKLMEMIESNQAEVVYGSRYLNKESTFTYWSNFLGVRFLTWLSNVLYGQRITDEATCYKMFRRDVLDSIAPLKCQRFEFCPEFTAKVGNAGYKIAEVPISYNGRKKKEGKKIHWWDGAEAAWTLIKYRFVD